MFTSAFDAETAVVARGDSRYDVRLSTAWDIGDNANGGYAMLPVLRSLREESGHSDPLSVTTHFLRPIQGGGDAEINTSLVRRGRSVSVLTGQCRHRSIAGAWVQGRGRASDWSKASATASPISSGLGGSQLV